MKQFYILLLLEKHWFYYAVIYNWLRNGFFHWFLSFMLTGIATIRILRIICLFCFLLFSIFFICWTEKKFPLPVNQSATKLPLSAGSQVNTLKINIQAKT